MQTARLAGQHADRHERSPEQSGPRGLPPRGKVKRQSPYRWPCAVAMRRGEAHAGLSMVPGVVYVLPYRLIENGKKAGQS